MQYKTQKNINLSKENLSVAFCTLGCKVNSYETDLMRESFEGNGYNIVDFNDIANIYVINSCSVTNLSTRKTRQQLSKAKRQGGIVVLAGCYAQEIKDKTDIKNVDIIIGNEEKNKIVEIVEEYIAKKGKLEYISDISKVKKYADTKILNKGINIRESVKIEDGCNNFCSYCIIPYVRGRVRSRKIEDITQEVENLVKSKVKEVVLVGIEIASYGKDLEDSISLIDVIEAVNKIEGLDRIRLGSIEPRVLTDEVIERLANVEKLCHHFHLSVQSLDDNVLKRMNRKYNASYVLETIEKIRKKMKDVSFTCDVIVGFPGETEEEFLNTYEMAKKIGFYEMHVFKYSKRKWTRAATMENQVDGKTAIKRSEKLIELASKNKKEYMEKFLNRKMNVIFESYKDGYLYGFTSNYIKVKVKGDKALWGTLTKVELCSIEGDLILGKLLQ